MPQLAERNSKSVHPSYAADQARAIVAVVIPCYRVRPQLARVLSTIGDEVDAIYCVDDACPAHSGEIADQIAEADGRIHVVRHAVNGGVGSAVLSGYRAALADGATIIVKLDGDGQMDPADIPALIAPLLRGEADYVKGNRFFRLEGVRSMPVVRLIGNAGLSFFSKLSTGYWQLFDPTNGYTALHASVARALPLDKLSRRYFFESDMLFRLSTIRAVVQDIPLQAVYGAEHSSLSTSRALVEFPLRHLANFAKRLFYNYFLRGFSIASVNLIVGMLLAIFGLCFGALAWMHSAQSRQFASPGTVMLAAMPILVGMQMLLSFLAHDMASVPTSPLHPRLELQKQAAHHDSEL